MESCCFVFERLNHVAQQITPPMIPHVAKQNKSGEIASSESPTTALIVSEIYATEDAIATIAPIAMYFDLDLFFADST